MSSVTSPDKESRMLRITAAAIVLVTAFVMFILELAVAKTLLPRFGGSPMVWTTCMMAYQALLLTGYGYAHLMARRGRQGSILHLALIVIAVVFALWRIELSTFHRETSVAYPFFDLITTLAATIALPFIAIAATSPLVQHWLRNVSGTKSVYTLYAVSNLGSFAGLLAYPFIIEPLVELDTQLRWVVFIFAASMGGMAWLSWSTRNHQNSNTATEHRESIAISRRNRTMWVVLPATTSALLLATTNELCQDLAAFPFLWVVPLALYLLSYTLTFRERALKNLLAAAAIATIIGMGAASLGLMLPVPVVIAALCGLLLVLSLAAHRELYELRPPVEHLTSFYLHASLGSVVGSVAVTFIPPLFFKGYWEFPASVLVVWVALVVASVMDSKGCLRIGDPRHAVALLGIVLYLIINQIPENWLSNAASWWPGTWSVPLRMTIAIILTLVLWLRFRHAWRPFSVLWPRVLAGLIIFMVESWLVQRVRNDQAGAAHVSRNFFGVVRLQEMLHRDSGLYIRQLTHGRINHGFQYMNPNLTREPTSYHSPNSGVGRLILSRQARSESVQIGVTGLGAGALAAYSRENDHMVFYEIDPQVVMAAYGAQAFFTFLNSSPGDIEVVLGDARQSLQHEWTKGGSRQYDVLALDAFSSDAVPTHLLTREAIEISMKHVKEPHGVLAVNISNRFLDLEPVMADSVIHLGLHAVIIDSNGDPPVQARSIWVLICRSPEPLSVSEIASVARPLTPIEIAWTDRFSSPFAIMKWWSPSARRVPVKPKINDGMNPLELKADSKDPDGE